jgi:hypothetical protein
MRLERVQAGDLILARIKGRSIYGEVLEVTGGEINFRPLCAAAGWHHASAREVVAHWRRTGRHHRTADEPEPLPKEQLSLQIWS